jgi:hypothetical protein
MVAAIPCGMSRCQLHRVAPQLRTLAINVEFDPRHAGRVIRITRASRVAGEPKRAVDTSQNPGVDTRGKERSVSSF